MTDTDARRWNGEDLLERCAWVQQLARGLVRQAADADDLSQDVLALSFDGPADRGVQNLGGWLRGAASHLAKRRRRDARHRRDRETAYAKSDVAADPAVLAEQAECQRALIGHVLALPEVHSSVLLRRYFEGLSPKEIAAAEGKSAAAISHRLSRAHAALRERLERAGGRSGWVSTLLPILALRRDLTGPKGLTASASMGASLMGLKAPALCALALALLGLLVLSLQAEPGETERLDLARAAPGGALPQGETSAAPLPTDADEQARARAEETGSIELTITGLAEEELASAQLEIRGDGVVRDIEDPADSGRFEVRGLPVAVPLELGLRLTGESVPMGAPPVVLEPDEVEKITWELPPAAEIMGTITDQHGAPRAGLRVTLVRGGDRFLPYLGRNGSIQTTKTDDEGGYRFRAVPPGQYGVGVAKYPINGASGHPLGKEIETIRHTDFVGNLTEEEREEMVMMGALTKADLKLAPAIDAPGFDPPKRLPGEKLQIGGIGHRQHSGGYAHRVAVPRGRSEVEANLTIDKGLYIQGRLMLSNGAPFQCAEIRASRTGSRGHCEAIPLDDGRFCLGPLPAGEYRIDAVCDYHPWFLEHPVRASAGATDLRITLSPAASVNGTVRSPLGGEPVPGRFTVTGPSIGGEGPTTFEHYTVGYDPGFFTFDGLRPGRYTFAFYSRDKQWFGWARDVELKSAREHAGFSLQLEPAGSFAVGRARGGFERTIRVYHQGDLARVITQYPPKKGKAGDAERVFEYAVPAGELRVEVTDSRTRTVTEQTHVMAAGKVVALDG